MTPVTEIWPDACDSRSGIAVISTAPCLFSESHIKMAERKYTHGLTLTLKGPATVLDIGKMEIWDGADLSLIRDTIFRLVNEEGIASVGIDVSRVQHVPSGFFGMLFDWYEQGVTIRLHEPRERVRKMLWFRKFFFEQERTIYCLHDGEGVNEEVSEELWDAANPKEEGRIPLVASPLIDFTKTQPGSRMAGAWETD